MKIQRRRPVRATKFVGVMSIIALVTSMTAGVASADGTETLGTPSIAIAEGSGFVASGVGLVDAQPGTITLDVPAGATVAQALLYWEGQNGTSGGDDTIAVNEIDVVGALIGGPTLFFQNAWSSTYRADITDLGLIGGGTNSVSVSGMDFTRRNDGAGILVIYDDGSRQDLGLVDGNDLAFVNFEPPLDTTVPQTFTFDPVPFDRVVRSTMFASSVTPDGVRPNAVIATVDGVQTIFPNPFDSLDGGEWDTAVVEIDVPAGATSLTLQAVSQDLDGSGGLPASFAWIGSATSIPLAASLGDFVWLDDNGNGLQDPGEPGVRDVLVTLNDCDGNFVNNQTTDADGEYLFTQLQPGCYQVTFTAPDGSTFTTQDVGDDGLDSDADPSTGEAAPVTLVSGEQNLTIDAGLARVDPGVDIEKLTNGNQADGANDADVPQIAPGDPVTWTYIVTNTGEVAFDGADVDVVDDVVGQIAVIVDQGDGDDVLSPGEVWTYEASAVAGAEDLANPSAGTVIVSGCNPDGTSVPGDRATYENIGTVTVPGDSDSDPSHYCNPPLGSIGDFVWDDLDRDGVQDPGEPGIEDAVVTLTDCDGNELAQQTTGTDGAYLFDGLTAGCYKVTFELPPGYAFTTQNVGDDGLDSDADPVTGMSPDVNLGAGENNPTIDAGGILLAPGVDIEKLTNGNQADGANDADVPQIAPGDPVTWTYIVTNTGEVAFDGADVDVVDDVVGQIAVIVDQGDGDDVLSPGEVWTYEASAVAGAEDLANPSAGTVIVSGCNPDGTSVPGDRATYENIGTVTVPGDSDSDPSHYCNPPLGSIGDFVWDDLDRDGVQDPGEPGIEDAVVTLTDCDGNELAQQTTGTDGAYLFDGLTAGCYKVTFELPPGYAFTTQNVGDDGLDSDADPVTGMSPDVNLGAGENNPTIDAGGILLAPGVDIEKLTNGNQADGANDADVPQIAPGDPVTWTYIVTNTGEVAFDGADVDVVDDVVGQIAVIVDQGDGDDVLSPGEVWTYEASAVAGAEDLANPSAGTVIVSGCNPDGTSVPGDRATYENIGTVTVPGDSDSDPSHYCNPPLGSIGDFVWDDLDRDGVQDPGEPGIEDAVVTLTDCDGNELAQQTTGTDGAYLFDGLTAGCYKVTFELPPGYAFTTQNVGDDGLDSDADPVTGMSPDVNLGAGENNPTIDAGGILLAPGVDIEKLTNGNQADGANDADVPQIAPGDPVTWTYIVTNTGEVAFDGADVDVVDDVVGQIAVIVDQGDGDDVLSPGEVWTYEASAVAGAEDLANPSAGTVIVSGCNPDGTSVPGDRATYENIGTVTVPGDSDSDPSHYCNPPLGSIGDFVWDDLDRDGVQDPGEPGIEDAVVTLTDCDGNELAQQTTGTDGAYLFDGLTAGCYKVTFELPPGYAFTTQNVGDDGLDSDADPVTGMSPDVNLGAGENNPTIDAGGILLAPGVDIEKFTKVIPTQTGEDLCDVFDKPALLTMIYTGDGPDGSSNSQDPGKAVVTGDPNNASPVRIVASKDAGGGGDVYFDGTVELGEEFVISAANADQDNFASATHVTIYDGAGNVLQQIEFHTSCSQPLFIGDQFGAALLVGFTDKTGAGATLPPPSDDFGDDADEPTGPSANTGDTIQWTYVVTNPGDLALGDVVVTDDNGTASDPTDDFVADPILDGAVNVGDTNGDGLLDPGEEWLFRALGIAQLGQYVNLGAVVGQPFIDGSPAGDRVTDDDPSHYVGVFGGDLCEAFGKPALLTMIYTGDGPDGSSNSQDPGKAVVTGDPNNASPVRIVASDDEDGGGDVYFDGTVELGEEFVISAANAGEDKFSSATYVTIYDAAGNVLQRIEFHTSCSQPLFIGDQFGAVQLADFVDEDGDGPGTVPPSGAFLDAFEFKGKEVKLKVTNAGLADIYLTAVEVAWPTSTNGGLTEVKRGGDSIFKPSSPVTTSPVTLTESDWKEGPDKRTIKSDDTEDIKFKFENDVVEDTAVYSIVLTFSDGSTVTFGG